MKKIAFVFDGLGEGGIERIGVDYIRMCKDLGYDVEVYNLNPKCNVTANFLSEDVKVFNRKYSRLNCPELYSYGVQKWWWGKYAYAIISPVLTLVQQIRKLFTVKRKYDVAIAIAGHINDLSFVTKGFIKADKKICWCHGNILSYFAICDAYPILYKKVDKFVVLSSAGQKDIYGGHKFMYSKEIVKIYNPTFLSVDTCNKKNVEEYNQKFGNYLLQIGRQDFNKSQNLTLKVLKKNIDRGLNIKVVFVGTGDNLEANKKLATELGISDYCYFMGYQSNVVDYIAASYVNILTSKWEGLPTVMIEAMTLGKPCIMTKCDDGEVSGNGKYCKLVDVDDVDALADSVYELYTNPDEYKKYQQLSLERAKEFSPETVKEKIKNLFE